ncbi:MAG: nucleoid-associated protein [Lachnospiraceae bacterium]|nr:nucleoid-associated protein [Lachnospiraceae bacterium]MDY5497595.1 nucleoid-associated protein [Anaerobutyricum sp.]
MIARDDIIIRKAILHILDTNRGECILSDTLLNPGPDLHEFIRNHIFKILSSDDTKNCEFNPETSPVYSLLNSWDEADEASFISTSQEIAKRLYNTMGEGLDIPAADLLFVTFQAEGIIYLALLKMNYKESYTHEIITSKCRKSSDTDVPEEDLPIINNGIIKSHSLLPSASSRIPEAVIINLSDLHIKLLEKRYEINGEKTAYLSENFLICHTSIPPKKKLNILTKVINNISNKYDGADLKVKMDTKSALQKEYLDHKSFDIEEIGNRLFGKSPEKKSEFDEKMEQYDLQYDNFTVANESTVKKLEKQVMVTDSGIEISIPMETYNKLANFEVKTDVTGKSTIIIRNIDNLILK